MIVTYEKMYEGVNIRRASANVMKMLAPVDGDIKRFRLIGSSSTIFGVWYFTVKLAGTALLTGGDRLQFTPGDFDDERSLDVPVTEGQVLQLDLVSYGLGVLNGPLTLLMDIEVPDDYVTASSLDTDGTLAANSDSKIATQKAVKTYVDQLLGTQDAMVIKGAIDASTEPDYPAADTGHTYRISVAGRIGGAAGPIVGPGDTIICVADSTASGDHATVGSSWIILETNVQGTVVTLTATQTLSNKRLTPRVGTTATSAAPTPDADAHDVYRVTALDQAATFAAPSGTPTDGQPLIISVLDDGTARALGFNAIYRAVGVTLPTTTVLGKVLILGLIYNSGDAKWDVVGVQQQA